MTATVINSVADLQNITNNLGGDFVLGSDIDLSGVDFTPIGSTRSPFMGTFDGNGFTINGMTINSQTTGANLGLFGQLGSGALVQNLGLTNVNLQATAVNSAAGGLAGSAINSTISGCYVTGSVSATQYAGAWSDITTPTA